MNNSDINKLLSMLSKMDKEDLAAGIAKAEKLLKKDDNDSSNK